MLCNVGVGEEVSIEGTEVNSRADKLGQPKSAGSRMRTNNLGKQLLISQASPSPAVMYGISKRSRDPGLLFLQS